MRSGAKYEVTRLMGENMQKALEETDKSVFFKTKENMINSADISEIFNDIKQDYEEDIEISTNISPDMQKKRVRLIADFKDDWAKKCAERGLGKGGYKKYEKDLVWHKICEVCGKTNPAGMARVCSSKCYLEKPLVVA